jgi:hypothetical protein
MKEFNKGNMVDNESIGDDFGIPAHIRNDVVQFLDGAHVGNELTVLAALVVEVPRSVDEGESPYLTFGQQVVQDSCFFLIEVVVDYG